MTSVITIIEIHVDGVPASGRVLDRSHASSELLLVQPFGALGLSDGRYVMAAAQRFVTFDGSGLPVGFRPRWHFWLRRRKSSIRILNTGRLTDAPRERKAEAPELVDRRCR